jgi:hypothetical protein
MLTEYLKKAITKTIVLLGLNVEEKTYVYNWQGVGVMTSLVQTVDELVHAFGLNQGINQLRADGAYKINSTLCQN